MCDEAREVIERVLGECGLSNRELPHCKDISSGEQGWPYHSRAGVRQRPYIIETMHSYTLPM